MQKPSSINEVDMTARINAFSSRLESLIDGMPLAAWAEKHGLNPQSLYNLKGKMPGLNLLMQIQMATGCSLDWLLGFSDKSYGGNAPSVHGHQFASGNWDSFVQIPFYDVQASAGYGAFAPGQENISSYLAFKRDFLVQRLRVAAIEKLYCIQVHGVSMEPALRNGHPALIDASDCEVISEGPYFLRLEGALLVKNLQRVPGGQLRIWSENQTNNTYPQIVVDWPVREDVDLKIFGRVRWSDIIF